MPSGIPDGSGILTPASQGAGFFLRLGLPPLQNRVVFPGVTAFFHDIVMDVPEFHDNIANHVALTSRSGMVRDRVTTHSCVRILFFLLLLSRCERQGCRMECG